MWNLVGFVVMAGVLLTVRWALRIWDATRPMPIDERPLTTVRVYPPAPSSTHAVPWEPIPAPSVDLSQQGLSE